MKKEREITINNEELFAASGELGWELFSSTLVNNNIGLVKKIVYTFNLNPGFLYTYEDLEQLAWEKFIQVIPKYNKENKWSTFISICIKNYLIKVLNRENKKRKQKQEYENYHKSRRRYYGGRHTTNNTARQ